MNFQDLEKINVNEHIETRTQSGVDLKYLSWTWALTEFKKAYPDFTYEVKKSMNEKGVYLPYMYDENTGYMVSTSITAGGLTQEMWLPVMDSQNKAMKKEPYQYTTKTGKVVTVQSATMFDVNKAIMRCLVKNMAMFGLGLYIYAGEDLPNTEPEPEVLPDTLIKAVNEVKTKQELQELYKANKDDMSKELKAQFNKLVSDKKAEFENVQNS